MQEHGEEPSKDAEYAGFKIGAWLEYQRSAYRKGKLPDDREELLDQLGIGWGNNIDTERSWVHHMAACSAYFEKTGKLPTQGDRSPEGLNIGTWLNHQRRSFRKGSLRDDRRAAIQNIFGDIFDSKITRWERNFKAYKDYVEKFGKQPERRTIHNDVAIGNWLCNTIRPNKERLSTEQVKQLSALGVVWEVRRRNQRAVSSTISNPSAVRATDGLKESTDPWLMKFQLCRELMGELSRKIAITDIYHSVNLGYWYARENQRYAAGGLSKNQRLLLRCLILLDESGTNDSWEWYLNYSYCVEFELEKSALLASDSKESECQALHHPAPKWFSIQTSLLEQGMLPAEQESAMKELLAIVSRKDSHQ
jgi:hypothetical protein